MTPHATLCYSNGGEKQNNYLLVEQLARLLLDGINELHLSGREPHQQGDTLCGGREVVEVMTRRLRALVDALVYGFAQVGSLEGKKSAITVITCTMSVTV